MSNFLTLVLAFTVLAVPKHAYALPLVDTSVPVLPAQLHVMKDGSDPHLFWYVPNARYIQCESNGMPQVTIEKSDELTTQIMVNLCLELGNGQGSEIPKAVDALRKKDPEANLKEVSLPEDLLIESLPTNIGGFEVESHLAKSDGLKKLKLTMTAKDILTKAQRKLFGWDKERELFATAKLLFERENFPVSAIALRCLGSGFVYEDPIASTGKLESVKTAYYCNAEIHSAPTSISVIAKE